MIGKEDFKRLIEEHLEQEQRMRGLEKVFETSFESPILTYAYKLFDQLIEVYFNESGEDWIYYYLYENPENCYYLNDQKVPLENIDDLWELVKDYRK